MIAIFNQLSGINAVLYYAPHIFKMAGAGEGSSLLQSVAIGGTFTIFTLAALLVIDKFGRKNLMIVGSVGYIVSLGVTAWAFYTYGTDFDEMGSVVVLVSLLVFIASHALGQGTVIWGVYQRDLSEPCESQRSGTGQLHPLVYDSLDLLDFSGNRRDFRWTHLCLLCTVYGGPAIVGTFCNA
jgi:SP family xylose:H+ symportor-like MFS transporter